MNQLQQAVYKTLAFFDIFDYPLTKIEIFKWLNAGDKHENNLSDVEEALNQISEKVQTKNSFYFLNGKESIINERLKRYGYAEDKFKKAIKFIKIFRFIPFIKMIAVCNTLAYSNCGRAGDIDLFVVAKKNRLWLTRFLVISFLKLFKVRPTAEKKQDAIDAPFFLSNEDLNIEDVKISSQDIYLTHWVDQLVPIYDADNTYQKFMEANQWIKETLPNSIGYQLNDRRVVRSNLLSKIGNYKLNLFLNWQFLENMVKKYQLKIMPRVLKEMMNKNTRVVVSNKMLKFHRDDRRSEYQEKFIRALEH
ncbi:hypothetical protein KJ840_01505 [Patescibacteria group bacterium]|nr:hypothetical protein [Patescibacteria group bacterium]